MELAREPGASGEGVEITIQATVALPLTDNPYFCGAVSAQFVGASSMRNESI